MIVCAALRVKSESVYTPDGKTVIPCFRHCDGFAILRDLCPEKKLHIRAESGFINHRGEFVNREEAFRHAVECGQLSVEQITFKEERNQTMLFSEDLY